MEVLPPRTLLDVHRVLPPNHTGDPELAWTPLDIMIENLGGLGATNLAVDVVYDGRIAGTHEIPVIVPGGNRSISTPLMPVFGEEMVTIRLVKGPGAPRDIGQIRLDVIARPVLDVVGLEASPDTVVTGEKVLIEATVRNRGNASATGQSVELMVDGSVVGNGTIEGLGPGNETTVSTRWELRGEGVHSISAIAEGDDLAASPVAVEVKAASPSTGIWTVLLTMVLVSLAARRSRSGGRA
jgi:hypothetical protein